MYEALFLVLLGVSLFLFITGSKKHQAIKKYSGLVLFILTLFLFWFMDFWGEALWFENLGYANRFWLVVNSTSLLGIAGAVLGFLIIYLLTLGIPKKNKIIRVITRLVGVMLPAVIGEDPVGMKSEILVWCFNRIKDPILGKDTGFYLFSLPFYDGLYTV
jgi:uncharacterized membrane protein (UPF0182 family)